MVTSVLAVGTTAAASSDIVVTTTDKIVALYRGDDDNFLLPDGSNFLLPDGDLLLLPIQSGDSISYHDNFPIEYKDPLGSYNPSGIELNSRRPFYRLGPGTWRVLRPVVTTAVGIQAD